MSEVNTSPPVLSVAERRVLGVLVEKAKTTPDIYPLSINALVTGSNQKSNREPVLNLSDLDVENALASAQQRGLVTRIQGGRVEKWKHNLYELLNVNKVELAVVAELLLRGPQTEGELRGRASRMEPIADVDALRTVLRPMAERGLVLFLGPEGRRGTLITHGFHAPEELDVQRRMAEAGIDLPPAPNAPLAPDSSRSEGSTRPDLANVQSELDEFRQQLLEVQQTLASLTAEVRDLKARLGG